MFRIKTTGNQNFRKIYFPLCFITLYSFTLFAQQDIITDYSQAKSNSGSTSFSHQKISSGQLSTLEQQARQKGYSEQQIKDIKQRYLSKQQSSTTHATYISDYSKPISSDDTLSLTTDSSTLQNPPDTDSVTDSLAVETTDSLRLAKDTLPFFGYSLFSNTPDAFKPNSFGPVDPGYLAGPGDILRLSVWGEVEFQYELKINKDGKIFIPVAGQVYVSGIPFEQLQKKIQNILSKHYSGLASQPQKSFMDLSVAQIRPIRIFVMGEVSAPGGYTVATSSTSFNAFYSIGGPLLSGTLRNIKVLRNHNEISTLDMYEYLTTGKCSTDVRLQNDDILFIPRREKTITLIGSVFRPAVYELRQDENLQALLTFCGGILPGTNIIQASIHRVKPFDERTPDNPNIEIIGLDLQKHIMEKSDFPLFDDDTLEITPLSNDLKNYVTLNGAVQYPGIYQCDNLSLHKLIFTFGKPIESLTYTPRADLIRLNPDMTSFVTIPINLDTLMNNPSIHDLMLQPFDQIVIYEKNVEKPLDLLITIDGEVRKPGTYSMSTNMTVTDAILHAGGFTREAFKKSVDLFRMKLSDLDPDTLSEVYKIELPDSLTFSKPDECVFQLKDRDKIVVRPDPDYIVDNYITINGLVRLRGKYVLRQRGERLSDIITRAGGLLPDAFLDGATVFRNGKRLVINFKEALSGRASKENILLQKNDIISIPSCPNTVLINGNVNNPGLFSFVQKTRLKAYINRAGGLADSTSYILLTSPSGETQKINRHGLKNPIVLEGSEIIVMKKVPHDKLSEKQGPTISEVVKDTLAILASAVTIIGLAIQLNK